MLSIFFSHIPKLFYNFYLLYNWKLFEIYFAILSYKIAPPPHSILLQLQLPIVDLNFVNTTKTRKEKYQIFIS